MIAVGSQPRPSVAVWRRRATRGVVYATLLLVTVVMLYPFWFMGRTSLRSLTQYYLGRGYSLTSWHDLFQALPVGRELFNSTVITTGSIASAGHDMATAHAIKRRRRKLRKRVKGQPVMRRLMSL